MKVKKSYYKQEDGVKYDAALLDKADQLEEGDGKLSKSEAKNVIESSLDAFKAEDRGTAGAITDVEKQTLKKTHKFHV